jgi:hypothetical protein
VSRSLFEALGKITDSEYIYDGIKASMPLCYSNYARLTEIMKTHLKAHCDFIALHDAAFKMTASIAEHKATYEKAMGNTFNGLLLATARSQVSPAPSTTSKSVLRQIVKVKIDKNRDPKISVCHTKALIKNAVASESLKKMINNGVSIDIAQQAVRGVYDPVVGAGAADPNIWGPVV